MDHESSMALGKTLAIVAPLIVGGIIFVLVVTVGAHVEGIGSRPFWNIATLVTVALGCANLIGWAIRWAMPREWKE